MSENPNSPPKKDPIPAETRSGGWGSWGFSVFSDLQKAASTAADEISKNAVSVVKSLADIQDDGTDKETNKEDEEVEKKMDKLAEDSDDEKLRKSALDRLENASGETLLGQGLKTFDNSVENFASGAWKALGNALKGSSILIHQLEHSAANLADAIQQGGLPAKAGSLAPSLIETGKAFTSKGMQVLETVGKETIDLLVTETGIEIEKNPNEKGVEEEQFLEEEATFERCFYIYGGPEQLEELEALSSHHALLFNRRKTKLSSEQKSFYDGKLRQVQQIFILNVERNGADPHKGKSVASLEAGINEMETLRDSSVKKAADLATGFTAALAGLPMNEIVLRTADRLESIQSEGVHRLSELCCSAISHLLMLGKSVIASVNQSESKDSEDGGLKCDWPEDSIQKANIIRAKAQSMAEDVEAVSCSFVTGVSDVVEAYLVAMNGASADANVGHPEQTNIQQRANSISNHIQSDQRSALGKIRDAIQYLAYVVVSTSMPNQ